MVFVPRSERLPPRLLLTPVLAYPQPRNTISTFPCRVFVEAESLLHWKPACTSQMSHMGVLPCGLTEEGDRLMLSEVLQTRIKEMRQTRFKEMRHSPPTILVSFFQSVVEKF